MSDFFVGVEGGATSSKVMLLGKSGNIVHIEDGAGSNLFVRRVINDFSRLCNVALMFQLLGMNEAVTRTADLVKLAISRANLPQRGQCLAVVRV